jgi:antitoxin CcdA
MSSLYNSSAPKRATTLTINSDLISQAKTFHINISSVLESALADKVKQAKNEQWLRENIDSISSYNSHVEDNGVFSDELRSF